MFNIDQIIKSIQTDPNLQRTLASGAAGLGAGWLLSGGKFGKLAGNALKAGAIAAIGGLAYSAWQKHQASQGRPSSPEDAFVPPPQASYQQEELGKSLVRAMIAGAKADGKIDADEKERIFKRIETMPLSAEEKAFIFDELASPLDVDAVVARADTPEHAAEIYAATLVAMTADTPAERDYLQTLAQRLKLEPGLVAEIHRHAEQVDAAPVPASGSRSDSYMPSGNV